MKTEIGQNLHVILNEVKDLTLLPANPLAGSRARSFTSFRMTYSAQDDQ
jgi:hypothetical protein